MPPHKPRSRADFEIALLCALKVEAEALESHAIFDKYWGPEFDIATSTDNNSYTTGVVGEHNVVLLRLARMGKTSASGAITDLRRSFPGIRLCLVIGVCGAVPETKVGQIYLGDLVFSTALIQYDFGRQTPKGFARKVGAEESPTNLDVKVAGVLNKLETRRSLASFRDRVFEILEALAQEIPETAYPGTDKDHLYRADYEHRHRRGCAICRDIQEEACDAARESLCDELHCEEDALLRKRSQTRTASSKTGRLGVHFGRIGSADTVMRSGLHRDKVARENTVIAFEMEGAGVWNYGPSIVVKGVCDYCDAHKNKSWQFHASAVAAAGAKAFLEHWAPTRGSKLPAGSGSAVDTPTPIPIRPSINDSPSNTETTGAQAGVEAGLGLDNQDSETIELWFEKFKRFRDLMLPDKHRKTAVKIAILDTGFSSNTALSDVDDRVKTYGDFIRDEKRMIDEDLAQNGTRLVHHLCRLWPQAHCIVGRVARSHRFDFDDKVAANAIKWAIDHKGAHIVVLTLGFEKPVPLLRQAIQNAVKRGYLVLAAADCALNEAKFVSTAMIGVYPIFAANAHGALWAKNPSPFKSMPQLAFLGEDVPVFTQDGRVVKSGTTVAAVTAAAAVGIVMQYVHQLQLDGHVGRLAFPGKYMPLVFKYNSDSQTEYDVCKPWELVEGLDKLDAAARRALIIERLQHAM